MENKYYVVFVRADSIREENLALLLKDIEFSEITKVLKGKLMISISSFASSNSGLVDISYTKIFAASNQLDIFEFDNLQKLYDFTENGRWHNEVFQLLVRNMHNELKNLYKDLKKNKKNESNK